MFQDWGRERWSGGGQSTSNTMFPREWSVSLRRCADCASRLLRPHRLEPRAVAALVAEREHRTARTGDDRGRPYPAEHRRERVLKRHGDVGLGTFVGLDGEGVMLDGQCWRAVSDGRVMPVSDDVAAPFWVTARFKADRTQTLTAVNGWAHLCAQLDGMRPSGNLFAALRVRGAFELVHARVACRARPGAGLVEATSSQSEFHWGGVAGTLIGFWTPEWARTINVPGFHLHFLSDDRRCAGHVIDVRAKGVVAELHAAEDLHLVLPANEAFLRADLSGDPEAALAKAEGGTAKSRP